MENYGSMEKNYGTMDKTMVIYWELWNFDSLRKKHGRLPKSKKLWFIMEKLQKYTKLIEVLNRFIALELLFTMEKLWYYGKNYGTLIYYGKNYGTMEKTMVL